MDTGECYFNFYARKSDWAGTSFDDVKAWALNQVLKGEEIKDGEAIVYNKGSYLRIDLVCKDKATRKAYKKTLRKNNKGLITKAYETKGALGEEFEGPGRGSSPSFSSTRGGISGQKHQAQRGGQRGNRGGKRG